jgi:TolB-like protein/DNA-binding winged helix-turn-helix (wHTH) protein/Tfp pilus assembly protein PilF
MPASASSSPLLCFADFEVNLRAGELFKLGNKVRIQERPFQVLSVLLERAGEVVTREELSRRVWPADTFVDFDHSLAVAINKVREALGDSAEKPRFVETVGRRGYRFLVPVEPAKPEQLGEGQPQTAVAPSPPVSPASQRERRMALVGSVLTILLFLGFFIVRGRQQRAAASVPPSISSIAVLPLKNLSNDPGQDYFADGMTDELITDLAHLPGLRVISRTSIMRYQDTRKTMPEIARELNVDGVVEGTVVRLGDRVRIRTQLIYAPADQHIWAEAYERDSKDVLTLQANLAQDIAGEIRLTLTSQQRANLATSGSVNPAAHELYLKGRYFWNKRDQAGLDKAVEYFQQAIAKDPGYAAAYAGLADAYVLGGGNQLVPMAEVMPKAKAAAEKALELDSNLAEAHASLGLIAPFLDWNWADAKRHFERAIALNPNYATAHHWYAEAYLMPMGRADEAIAEVRKAQQLDPLSAIIATDLAKELYFVRRYDEAIVELRRALELDPNFVSAHNWLSDTFLEKGMYSEALAELEKTKPLKEERIYLRQTAYLYARMGRRAEAERALAKSLQLSRGKTVSLGAVALVYAALGEKNKAFVWLEKAYAVNSSFMSSLKYWSVFDPLRSDPRFVNLIKRVGLES